MSLSSALNAARSGLTFTSRWAQTASTNISNASTDGYARRSLKVNTTGMGEPEVSGIARAVDSSLDRMFRLETARTGRQTSLAEGLSLYTSVLGQTDSSDSILSRMTDLRASLGLLSVTPSDTALQRAAVTDAQEVAQSLNRTNEGLLQARKAAQDGVTADLSRINDGLQRLADLNSRIAHERENSDLRLSLGDQITQELDKLAPLMDLTVRTDSSGRVEIFAPGGTELLHNDEAQVLSYDIGSGRLFAGTTDITPGIPGVRGLEEGSISGRIELLNSILPEMQSQIDEMARALIDGFAGADPSLAPGQAGLFTDAGAALTGVPTPGLAGRIAVNDAARPEMGGALWRMRDGVGAAVEGAASDPTQINAFITMFDEPMSFDPALGLGGTATLSQYASTLIANQQQARAAAESERDLASAGAETVQATRMGFMGVNVDDELQQLMQIEQAYGANSQVMRTVNTMLQTLLDAF